MPIPQFIVDLRARIGHDPLWLIGVTAVVIRGDQTLLVERSDNGVAGEPYPADEESTDARWCALSALPDMPERMRKRITAALG